MNQLAGEGIGRLPVAGGIAVGIHLGRHAERQEMEIEAARRQGEETQARSKPLDRLEQVVDQARQAVPAFEIATARTRPMPDGLQPVRGTSSAGLQLLAPVLRNADIGFRGGRRAVALLAMSTFLSR